MAATGISAEQPTKRGKTSTTIWCWPSSLDRAGHTEVTLDADSSAGRAMAKLPRHEKYGIRMGRMCTLPCHLVESSKFRNGKLRWWCPIHQGTYGTMGTLKSFSETGTKACDKADDPIDWVAKEDVPIFKLVGSNDDSAEEENGYVELGVWIGLPPAVDTLKPTKFFPGIHVHARKTQGGRKVVDTNFPAVIIQDKTGRFPAMPAEGVAITSPAALEYLYYMESVCPVNAKLRRGTSVKLPRPPVELTAEVRCKHCKSLHEDVGDFFGGTLHKKHLCGQCGRDIWGAANIANPLCTFKRDFRRAVVGTTIDEDKASLRLDSKEIRGLKVMIWPSTPAIFWSRDGAEVWGVHVHAFNMGGERVIDDTFGRVWLDGKELDRADLFKRMLEGVAWMRRPDAVQLAQAAEELEDD